MIGQEAKNFVNACEAIHELLAQGPLTPNDHTAIELTGMALLDVMPTHPTPAGNPPLEWQ